SAGCLPPRSLSNMFDKPTIDDDQRQQDHACRKDEHPYAGIEKRRLKRRGSKQRAKLPRLRDPRLHRDQNTVKQRIHEKDAHAQTAYRKKGYPFCILFYRSLIR
ncbi:MAG: hypothetical protein Q4D08_08750, partial [Clostridia bacterium]|nr:hypothetical protein [Clostridia bacterium]